ncbi:XRE family transcriptional regulator [Streptomyces sp. NPDC002690]
MDQTRRIIVTAIPGAALAALATTWAAAGSPVPADGRAHAGTAVGDELVASLEAAAAGLTAQTTEERRHTAPVLDALLSTVTHLIDEARYDDRLGVRLHILAAGLAQTVGWHRFDLGHHGEAARYWVGGMRAAHAIGDHDLRAALLGDLAYQASWRDRPRTAAGILERALVRVHHPAAQALLRLRLARSLAAQGERQGALRALTAAEHLLGAPSDDPVPAWCAWLSEADLAVDSGQALLDLGDTRRAHLLIREGRKLLPPARNKTQGVFLAYAARSHLDLGEPDTAAAAATGSYFLAKRIGAPRCERLVRDLAPRFAAHPTAQGVPELLELMAR